MKIAKKEAIIIVAIVFVITAAVYYVYFLMPFNDEMDQIDLSIEQKLIQIMSMESSIELIPEVKSEIDLLENKIAEETKGIPKGISHPLQLAEITKIINDEDSEGLVTVFSQNAETFENYQINTVDINFSTTYEKLILMLTEFSEISMTNQIVTIKASNTDGDLEFYSKLREGFYLSVGMTIDFYSFYKDIDAEPIEKQPFEDGEIEYKNPFVSDDESAN